MGETLQDIEDAIQRAVDGGADDIFFYYTGHGGRTDGGESYLAFKDTAISPQQLADMLKKFPEVRFKVVIDACYSGGFVDTLAASGMVDIVLTASSATESSYDDWDPANDPNKGDTGGEYSSGLWEDLNEIVNSPELQERAKQIAEEKGWPEFVAWLTIADTSAIQKDAWVINGVTHPQSFISTPATATTPQYDLTIRVSGNGSATGAGTYSIGEAASIVATPDAGWEFDYWGGDVGTVADPDSASTTITMDADKAIIAFFVPLPTATTPPPLLALPEIAITPDIGVVVGDEVAIGITGLTSNGDFTETVCVNGDCNSYNLTADADGNFDDVLIPDAAGTTTVAVVDETTGATAEASFEVSEPTPTPTPTPPQIIISSDPSLEITVGDEVTISITGLTPNGAFTKTVCVNGDCEEYNLTADASGNFEGVLIPDTAGTTAVTVVDETAGTTAEASFEVAEAPLVL
jgi:hypothetical protein